MKSAVNSLGQRPGLILLSFAAYLMLTIGGGALTSPWVHAGLVLIVDGPIPFNEVALRWMQVLALGGLWPLLWVSGLGFKSGFGLGAGDAAAEPSLRRELLTGTMLGAMALGVIVLVLVALDVRHGRADRLVLDYMLLALLKAALTAFVVAAIEEFWFRGALHSVFRRGFQAPVTIGVLALLYATVHFLRSDQQVDPTVAGAMAGFEVLGLAFDRFAGSASWSDFIALTLGGMWLGIARERRANVWVCIGLHAGWVIVIQFARRVTTVDRDAELAFLVGRFDGVIGWLGVAVFALFVTGYYLLTAPRASPRASPCASKSRPAQN